MTFIILWRLLFSHCFFSGHICFLIVKIHQMLLDFLNQCANMYASHQLYVCVTHTHSLFMLLHFYFPPPSISLFHWLQLPFTVSCYDYHYYYYTHTHTCDKCGKNNFFLSTTKLFDKRVLINDFQV